MWYTCYMFRHFSAIFKEAQQLLRWMPPWRWQRNAGTCSRFNTLYIIVSKYSAVVGGYVVTYITAWNTDNFKAFFFFFFFLFCLLFVLQFYYSLLCCTTLVNSYLNKWYSTSRTGSLCATSENVKFLPSEGKTGSTENQSCRNEIRYQCWFGADN